MRPFSFFLASTLLLPILAEAPKPIATKSLGSAVAPVMIEVFSDFQCPACKNLHDNTLKPLINEFVNTKKKVYLVHREFPLPIHAYARTAACYACAAERLGKYEQVGDALFDKQETWAKDGNIESALQGVLTATEMQKVRALSKDPGVVAEVNREIELGKSRAVGQTPTMFISYKGQQQQVPGGVSYALLRRYLEDLLSK